MTIFANAKINLTLEVFGKRPDGYHALRSFVVPISLADKLDIETTNDGSITSDTGFADDLCLKAAHALASSLIPHPSSFGARIHVTKRIPVGGGLGGGSADAAATLLALNELWQLNKSPEELAQIGAVVGSDVPSLVLAQQYHCPVLMEGRGEKVTPLFSLGKTAALHFVLANPGVPSSTKDVYAACVPRAEGELSATEMMVKAWVSGDVDKIVSAFRNDLQEPAVHICPAIDEALFLLKKCGAEGVMMSGSGSSVFGLVRDAATALRLASELTKQGLHAWPISTDFHFAASSFIPFCYNKHQILTIEDKEQR